MNENTLSIRARRKYKAQIEKIARENEIAKFNKRMEFVKLGIAAQGRKDYKNAAVFFHQYLEALQKGKEVKDLTPKCFHSVKESAEMLMLTGVYWDLAKIYDRVLSKDKVKLRHYIEQFVLFSDGASYQRLSLQMLRKFLMNEEPRNRDLFKEAYVKLGGGKCFVATSVEEYCLPDTLRILRRFRDERLAPRIWGRAFIRIYYGIGPWLAIRVIRSPVGFQRKIAQALNGIASAISFRSDRSGK